LAVAKEKNQKIKTVQEKRKQSNRMAESTTETQLALAQESNPLRVALGLIDLSVKRPATKEEFICECEVRGLRPAIGELRAVPRGGAGGRGEAGSPKLSTTELVALLMPHTNDKRYLRRKAGDVENDERRPRPCIELEAGSATRTAEEEQPGARS